MLPCGHKEIQSGCRFCQEFRDNPKYRSLILAKHSHLQNQAIATKENQPCIFLGEDTKERVECSTCSGKVELKVFKCEIHGECTIEKPVLGRGCCNGCLSKSFREKPADPIPLPPPRKLSIKQWSYGITTVPSRLNTTLPKTILSLKNGGFDSPILFQDGDKPEPYRFTLERIVRPTVLRGHGNWVLSMYELYIRKPNADYYALFQDDLVTYHNLRPYLEKCQYPQKGYWNLYTFPENESLANGKKGWYESNQLGKGAVGLIFNRDALTVLLTHRHLFDRPQEATRGWRAIDGGIVTAMKKAGYKEYVHNPSLVQHTGTISTLENRPHPQSVTFLGESFNAINL